MIFDPILLAIEVSQSMRKHVNNQCPASHLKAELVLYCHDDFHMVQTVQTEVLCDVMGCDVMLWRFVDEYVQVLYLHPGNITLMKCESRANLSADILSKALQTASTRPTICSCKTG